MHDFLAEARSLDAADPLRSMRDMFRLPQGIVYLDGNSLGALPLETQTRVAKVMSDQWGKDLIKSWLVHDWMHLPQRVGAKIGQLIGARPGEVVVTDSTSVNLYKCLHAALRLQPERRLVLSETDNFPTDLYVPQGIEASPPARMSLKLVDSGEIEANIDAHVCAVLLTHVHYKTARMYDMQAITRRAHECGAIVIWDLSHSAGAVPVDLDGCDADFAVGCGYKYLNGGPGSPAYMFVSSRLQERVHSPITGWLGHARPFDFGQEYAPAGGIDRFLCGTHPVIGLVALESGVDCLLAAPRQRLWEKSQRLCELFIRLIDARCRQFGVEVISPRYASERGSHVGVRFAEALPVIEKLISQGIVGDFRAPDIMRFGFAPLYVGYEDVWRAVDALHDILGSRTWDRPEFRIRKASG